MNKSQNLAEKWFIRPLAFVLIIALACGFSGCGKEEQEEFSEVGSAGSYAIENIPEFVPTEDKFLDTAKKYVLPDGYLYEYAAEMKADFTNYADIASEDWEENSRVKSDGSITPAENLYVTNFIPCVFGDIIRVKNADAVYNYDYTGSVNWCFYDSEKNIIAPMSPYGDTSEKIIWNEKGEIETAEVGYIHGEEYAELGYIRITLHLCEGFSPEDVIITVNEEIAYSVSGDFAWKKTEQYVPEDWYSEINDASQRVKEVYRSETGMISFLLSSDIHLDPEFSGNGYIDNIGKVSAEVMRRCGIPFFVSLGDISTQSTGYDISVFDDCMEQILEVLSPIPQRNLLITVGNHDGATGKMETGGDPIYYMHQLNNEQRSRIFFDWQRKSNPEKQFSADGTYYFIDDENTKTRYIMLNSFWSEWEGDPETGYVTDIQHAFMQTPIYGQEQLSWFANEALDMPKGYHAVIGTHHASSPKDYEMLKNIIEAYVNKDKYSGSYNGEQEWQSSSIEVNYSSAKGEIIAIFQGHNHLDAVDMETFAVPCINITTAGAYFDVRDENPPERTSGSATETAIDVVTIDTDERVIYLTRIGAGRDRRIDY